MTQLPPVCRFNTSPCVRSKRPCVYRHHEHMYSRQDEGEEKTRQDERGDERRNKRREEKIKTSREDPDEREEERDDRKDDFVENCNPQILGMNWIKMFRKNFFGRLFLILLSKVQNITMFSIIFMKRIRFFGPRESIQKYFSAARTEMNGPGVGEWDCLEGWRRRPWEGRGRWCGRGRFGEEGKRVGRGTDKRTNRATHQWFEGWGGGDCLDG